MYGRGILFLNPAPHAPDKPSPSILTTSPAKTLQIRRFKSLNFQNRISFYLSIPIKKAVKKPGHVHFPAPRRSRMIRKSTASKRLAKERNVPTAISFLL